MRIGLLHEGSTDERPLRSIVSRILETEGVNHPSWSSKNAEGPIVSELKKAFAFYKKANPSVNLVVVVSDTDWAPGKCREVKNKTSELAEFIEFAVGCPEKEIEDWLTADEGVVRRYFSIQGAEPVCRRGETCKNALSRLYTEGNFDIDITIHDVYDDLAKGLDLDALARNKSEFRVFQSDLIGAVRRVRNT